MKRQHKGRPMRISLIALLGVSACAPVAYEGGRDFCDVVPSQIQFPPEVAEVVVGGARSEAVRIDAQNRYWLANCGT